MSHQCPRCNHTKIIKSGFARGQQRFKCKNCNYQYTREKIDRGKPLWMKLEAILLYCSGMSFNAGAQALLQAVRQASQCFGSKYIELGENCCDR